jgi:hypothetical protein
VRTKAALRYLWLKSSCTEESRDARPLRIAGEKEGRMANPLNINMKEGDVVILAPEAGGEAEPPERRAFVCMAGDGMYNLTAGTVIDGHWRDGRGSGRIHSFMISAGETQAAHDAGK